MFWFEIRQFQLKLTKKPRAHFFSNTGCFTKAVPVCQTLAWIRGCSLEIGWKVFGSTPPGPNCFPKTGWNYLAGWIASCLSYKPFELFENCFFFSREKPLRNRIHLSKYFLCVFPYRDSDWFYVKSLSSCVFQAKWTNLTKDSLEYLCHHRELLKSQMFFLKV